MHPSTVKKISILGLVLMVAAAVTAAINTKKNKSPHIGDQWGVLIQSSIGSFLLTCVPNDFYFECTATGTLFTTTSGHLLTSRDYATVTASPTSYNFINTSVAGAD